MLIPCPHCGERSLAEFYYGGDGTLARPADPQAVPQSEWLDFVYLRDNPRGPHTEWWLHTAGCRRWIKVRRDTLNHEISASGTATDDLGPDEHR
jgi:sarcosine oxidase subunit delta